MLIRFLGLRIGREEQVSQAERLWRRGQLSGDASVILGRCRRRPADEAVVCLHHDQQVLESAHGRDEQPAATG